MESKENLIRKAALELFVESGFSTSTSSITKRAGVSSGILFHYFPTKDELIRDLFASAVESWIGPVLGTLGSLFSDCMPTRDEHERAYRRCWSAIIRWEIANWNEFLYIRQYDASSYASDFGYRDVPKVRKMIEEISRVTAAGIEAGYLRELPTDFLVRATLDNMQLVALYLHGSNEANESFELLEDGLWDSYWAMVARPEGD